MNAQTYTPPPDNGWNDPQIIGGGPIAIAQAPYQVQLRQPDLSHRCGGVIISDRWILTAAHCISPYFISNPLSLSVVAGTSDRINTGTAQVVSIQSVEPHPGFRGLISNVDDIGLIYLSRPLQFNKNVQPIEYANSCNTTESDISPNVIGFLTGWGLTAPLPSDHPRYLQGVQIPIISRAAADALNNPPSPLGTPQVEPVGLDKIPFYENGRGGYYGDSGGPAVISIGGNKICIGVCSGGQNPPGQKPSLYMNVRYYADWIKSHVGFPNNPTRPDLYTSDKPWDLGAEPSNIEYMWESEDIWVRKQNDGRLVQEHENPEYYANPSNANYVYVRVRNRGCTRSTGTEKVKLYWAKAATALALPDHWDGSLSVSGQSLGNYIGEATIPAIRPGSSAIVAFQWQPPNPANYVGLSSSLILAEDPHHFCLLSRIVAANDPMTVQEGNRVGDNTIFNNNVAWKNVTVVNLDPNNIATGGGKWGATVLTGDAWGTGGTFDLEFTNPPYYEGNPVTKEAEVKVTLDAPLWTKWEHGGFQQENIQIFDATQHQVLVAGERGILKNIYFSPNERNTLNLKFNFLTKEVSDKNEFEFEVVQRNHNDNAIVGGEQYKVYKTYRNIFTANAGDDKEIRRLATVTLSAYNIGEQAKYNWYDESGNLVFTGKDFTVSPEVTTKYKLEIIATEDGFKDYDEVRVKVKEFAITNVSPNPSNTFINVDYRCPNANSAYLMIVPSLTGTSHQYILNTATNTQNIDVSGYQSGQYAVILVCNGVVVDYQNILIN